MIYNDPTDGTIKVATYTDNAGKTLAVSSFYDNTLSSTDDINCKDPNKQDSLSVPHSSSFIDLDGDCMADIFLTKQHFN